MLSPAYTKDQKETKEAIEKLQEFINVYPESKYLKEASDLVRELDYKLELKAFSIAKQYNKIAPYSFDYNAAIKSFDNFLFDFPGSVLREDALYYRLDSAYKQAINSLEYKNTLNGIVHLKKERLGTTKEYYISFKKNFPNSKFMGEVDEMVKVVEEALKGYSTKDNT